MSKERSENEIFARVLSEFVGDWSAAADAGVNDKSIIFNKAHYILSPQLIFKKRELPYTESILTHSREFFLREI